MIATLFRLLGGIGLFLMGMSLMSDGLKTFAGDSLRRALLRFTGTPFKAFTSGALVTAVVQSSSATTVTLIGFVSAGLLTFPQAVGVVFGASLGTTSTGWIVSTLGLKISVGFYALPLVGVGAFMHLIGRGRWKALGMALAGFGLIFVGIDTLREGMQGLSQRFDLSTLPAGGWRGYSLALGIGFIMTVIMQSSSAAVATTLTALHTQSVNFEQAALLAIGAAVGTTVKGALVTIGAGVPAKRTALAHVLFNVATGVVALMLLPAFLWSVRWWQSRGGALDETTALAAFHSLFIVTGVLLFLPWTNPFARWIERVLPERGSRLTNYLDNSVLHVPDVALEAAWRALNETAHALFKTLCDGLEHRFADATATASRDDPIHPALDHIRRFFARIPPLTEGSGLAAAREPQMHAMDHLTRLAFSLYPPDEIRLRLRHPRLQPAIDLSRRILTLGMQGLREQQTETGDWLPEMARQAAALAALRRTERTVILRDALDSGNDPAQALELLDTFRWLDQMGYHVWRICHHLGQYGQPARPAGEAPDPDPGNPA